MARTRGKASAKTKTARRPRAPKLPTLSPAGDAGLLLRFEDAVSDALFDRIFAALARLRAARDSAWIDVMPGYASILVVFDPTATTPTAVRAQVEAALAADAATDAPPSAARTIEVPVLYHPDVAEDLLPLAAEKGLRPEELVARHTAPTYRCHMIGFRPGFPFLGGLDESLATPRLATPRLAVPAGAVAIGGRQTGIYPSRGPGGWRIIGRTPLVLFDPLRPEPFLIHPGDRVCFRAIDEKEFAALAAKPA